MKALRFKPPTRKKIFYWIEKKYDEFIKSIQHDISNVKHIAITTDGWTGLTTSFWSITLHWIDSSFKLQNRLLACVPILGKSHNTHFLHKILLAVLTDAGIPLEKIVAVTTDEGGAAPCLAKYFGTTEIHCAAHLSQTVLRNGFKQIIEKNNFVDLIFAICEDVASAYNRSPSVKAQIQINQLATREPINTLKLHCATRWSSRLANLRSVRDSKNAIMSFISGNPTPASKFGPLLLRTQLQFWKLVDEIIEVLTPFEAANRAFPQDSQPTLHLLIPIVMSLKSHLNHIKDDQSKSELISTLCEYLNTAIQTKFEAWDKFEYIALALHPALRKVRLPSLIPLWMEGKKLIEEYLSSTTDSLEPTNSRQSDSENPFPIEDAFFRHIYSSELQVQTTIDEKIENNEWEEFMEFKYTWNDQGIINYPILDFWDKASNICPKLAILAKKILCVPCSQAESERTFSHMGIIANYRRNRLNPHLANKILTIGRHIHSLNKKKNRSKQKNSNQTTRDKLHATLSEAGYTPDSTTEFYSEDDQSDEDMDTYNDDLEPRQTDEAGFLHDDHLYMPEEPSNKSRKTQENSTPQSATLSRRNPGPTCEFSKGLIGFIANVQRCKKEMPQSLFSVIGEQYRNSFTEWVPVNSDPTAESYGEKYFTYEYLPGAEKQFMVVITPFAALEVL